MAYTSTGYQAPATSREGLVPSVYDKIIRIGAEETPLMSLIGKSSVSNINHSWLIEEIEAPAKNAQLEISDFNDTTKNDLQKQTNAVQILTTNVSISRTMKAVKTYGGKELPRLTSKRAIKHKLDMEYALFGLGRDASVKVSVFKAPTLRADAIAGEMAGFAYFLAKGATSFTAGKRGNVLAFDATGDWTGAATTLDETKLHQILEPIWKKGEKPRDVFIGSALKPAINAFATRQFGNEKSVNTSVVSVDTDFGKVNFRLHRYLSAEFGLADTLLAGNFEYAKMGLLVPTEYTPVTTSKTAEQWRYYTEGTLEMRNADAFTMAVGLKA